MVIEGLVRHWPLSSPVSAPNTGLASCCMPNTGSGAQNRVAPVFAACTCFCTHLYRHLFSVTYLGS